MNRPKSHFLFSVGLKLATSYITTQKPLYERGGLEANNKNLDTINQSFQCVGYKAVHNIYAFRC